MIGVVCHDAGGAEVVSSFVRREGIEAFRFFLEGPAVSIFERKLGVKTDRSLSETLDHCDWILTGTSWKSDLEWLALVKARESKIKSVSILDHWVNYPERFIRNKTSVLPDEIRVGDEYAFSIASSLFPKTKITQIVNPYFLDMKEEIRTKKPTVFTKENNILYVCEPVKEHAFVQFGDEMFLGYTEDTALEYFLTNVEFLKPVGKIKLRPHPSEKIEKYLPIISKFPSLDIEPGGDKTLMEEILESKIVVGCESMAMVVGLIAGRRVISTIPFGGRKCVLPHLEIEHLTDIIPQ